MAKERAIDKLKNAFSVETRSSYTVIKGGEEILTIYWKPLTIADRDSINNTLKGIGSFDDENSLEYALQVIIRKAESKEGERLFLDGDRASLRREVPLYVLIDIMGKMQGYSEEAEPSAVKSGAEEE